MKYKNYSEDDMHQAIEAVKKGMPKATASKQFRVPRVTLLYKVTGKLPEVCRMGPSTVLTETEENKLEKWVLDIARSGFPISKTMLLDTVSKLLTELDRPNPFTDGRPGRKWFTSFMKRHPAIAQRTPEHLTGARTTVNEENIRRWFKEVKDYLTASGYQEILEDPARIFNADETAFYFCPKTGKVLGPKGEKNVYNASKTSEKENETVLFTVSAAGIVAPPTIIYPYKRLPADVVATVPEGWGIGKSDLGWMTGETFYEYMANVFYPWLVKQNIPLPIIFFVDGHNSHLTMHLSDFLRENQVILVALFPNATHILQPLDVAVFRPLKEGWKTVTRNWAKDNFGQSIGKKNFVPILKETVDQKLTVDSIRNGFRACGLYPFDENKVDYTKCISANVRKGSTVNEVAPACKVTTSKLTTKEHLVFLEEHIQKELLNEFKAQEDDQWEGEDTAKELFRVWQKINILAKSDELAATHTMVQTTFEENREQVPETAASSININEQDASTHLEHTESDVLTQPSTSTTVRYADPLFSEPSTSEFVPGNTDKTPQSLNDSMPATMPTNATSSLPKVSPFKRVLFWPEESKTKRKKKQEKIPAVATSDEWKKYHQKKQEEKDLKEKEKEERKKQRAAKALEKRKVAEEKKKARTATTAARQNKKKKNKKQSKPGVNTDDERSSWVCYECNSAGRDLSAIEKRSEWLVCDHCRHVAHRVCIPRKHLNLLASEAGSDSDAPFLCKFCFAVPSSSDLSSIDSDLESD